MPRLPIQIGVHDYLRIVEDAEAKGVSPLEQIQHVWLLGLAAAGAAQEREGNPDRQLVTAGGAAEGA